MKLNKVLALALSGVMAVSMLAGCKGATPDNGDQEQPPVVATSADDVMNKAQSIVKFTTSAEHTATLNSAMQSAKYDDAKAGNAIEWANTTNVFKSLKLVMTGEDNLQDTAAAFVPEKGKSNSVTILYKIESKNITEEYALILAASNLTQSQSGTLGGFKNVVTPAGGSDSYNATYTGEVSIAEVTKTDGDGANAESAYYILITVTQNVGDTKVIT